jgi:hypothetical protein
MRSLLATLLVLGTVARADTGAPPTMPTDPTTGLFQYQEVVTVEGATADVLFARAKGFVLDTYRSAKAVIDLDDPVLHRLAARGGFEVPYQGGVVTVQHKLSLEVKDGRYRYALDDFVTLENHTHLEASWVRASKLTARTAERCEALIAALKAAMSQPPKEW